MSTKINVLIASPSPRDIPEWLKLWKLLRKEADTVICKYMPEQRAYDTIRGTFLKDDLYDYLCIIPDDLLVLGSQFRTLRDEASDYQVLGGIFNRNWQDRNLYSIVTDHYDRRWLTLEQIEAFGGDIMKTSVDYFGCTFIRRDVVEKIPFHGNPHTSFDFAFSSDCSKLGIPLYVDTRVQMLHLANRSNNGTMEYAGLGKKMPYTEFVSKKSPKNFGD